MPAHLTWLRRPVSAAEQHHGDDLFSFTGLDSLSDPDCVPQWYRLPARFTLIADQCVGLVDEEQATGE